MLFGRDGLKRRPRRVSRQYVGLGGNTGETGEVIGMKTYAARDKTSR